MAHPALGHEYTNFFLFLVVAHCALLPGLDTENEGRLGEFRNRWQRLENFFLAGPLTGPPYHLKFVLNFLICNMRWLDCPF